MQIQTLDRDKPPVIVVTQEGQEFYKIPGVRVLVEAALVRALTIYMSDHTVEEAAQALGVSTSLAHRLRRGLLNLELD